MKRHTLISCISDKENHRYTVTIGTDMGAFTGSVKCQPADYKYESEYFGLELAELKAEIEYARAKRKNYEAQLKALTGFWKDMAQTRTYTGYEFWVKKMREKTGNVEAQMRYWRERVAYLKDAYWHHIIAADYSHKIREKMGV